MFITMRVGSYYHLIFNHYKYLVSIINFIHQVSLSLKLNPQYNHCLGRKMEVDCILITLNYDYLNIDHLWDLVYCSMVQLFFINFTKIIVYDFIYHYQNFRTVLANNSLKIIFFVVVSIYYYYYQLSHY